MKKEKGVVGDHHLTTCPKYRLIRPFSFVVDVDVDLDFDYLHFLHQANYQLL
jgi:hypothetical protein